MKNQVLTINEKENEVLTIDSREVAEMMGKEHKEILQYLEGRKNKNGKDLVVGIIPTLESEGLHYQKYFIKSTYKSGTREYKCYLITKLGCELLGNKQTGSKGILFSAKYVERFNEMEQYIKQENKFKLPQTYKEALQELLVQVEKTEQLQEENKILKPKAEDYNRLISAENNQTMNQVAKAIKVGRNKLFDFLRKNKILMKSNMPYQRYIDNGYFVVREFTKIVYGVETNMTQTLVTAKGIDFINKLLKKVNYDI